jgi:hypothetical protein
LPPSQGPVGDITVHVGQVFDAAQQIQLRRTLGLPDDADLRPVLEDLALAALAEYRDTFLVNGIPTRADDFQQRRLLQLVLHVFDELPSERRIATLFKLPLSRARSLLNMIGIRFDDLVHSKIEDDMKRVLEHDSEGTAGNREIFIRSTATRQAIDDLVDVLNSERSDPPYLDKLARHQTITNRYDIGEATLEALKKRLGI